MFRRRWTILLISLLGFGAGAAVFFLTKPTYESEAELLVKYVVDSRAVGADGSVTSVSTPGGSGGEGILNSEMMILSSLDLATLVAEAVGPSNIVTVTEEVRDPLTSATFAISRGLKVTVPPKSSILQLRFQHPDPQVARLVLTNIVAGYLRMHNRIHRSMDVLADLDSEMAKRQTTLETISAQLRQIQQELGVASAEDARRSYRDQITRTRGELFASEALLAEKRSSLATLAAMVGRSTNAPSATVTNLGSVPQARLGEYRNLRLRIDELTRKEQGLLVEYTDVSPFVQAIRSRLASLTEERNRMEAEFPALTSAEVAIAKPGETSGITAERMTAATLDVPALEAKIKTLNTQLEQIRAEAVKLDERAEEMEVLTRRKEIEERRFIQLATARGQAGVDQALTQDKTANIRITQQPTPASPTTSKTMRLAGGLAGGGIVLALLIAFGLEWYIDQSIRRRSHVESGLRIPLFLTIPKLRLPRRKQHKALPAPKTKAGQNSGAIIAPEGPQTSALVVKDYGLSLPATGNDADLGTWVETLRDRLIMHFEASGVTRKPKLIGLTSCGHGAGVTTLAAALAASLSETGDGRVLYVDMNPHRSVSVHPFHRGESKVALSQAFEGDLREAAQVQDNLYVVTISEPGSRRVGVIPRALAALMPKMKDSDYDYIIFDFPPVSQTSVTAKVAGLLDITFLVLDSEHTQSELAKNALTLMGEGKAKVSAVLNKHRRFLPRRLDPDI
jgi:uncharacterized protein involved in exopolysaccharide biosynthesis/Mrp family chromosome partitioning ATPase